MHIGSPSKGRGWSVRESVRGSLWDTLLASWLPWCPFGILLTSFWHPFGIILASFWHPFDMSLFDISLFDMSLFDISLFDMSLFDMSLFDISLFDMSLFEGPPGPPQGTPRGPQGTPGTPIGKFMKIDEIWRSFSGQTGQKCCTCASD